MLQEKNKRKQTKTSTTGSAPQEKRTINYPSPSQRRNILENLKLRVVVRPHTRTKTFLTPPLRFLRALRWSRPSTLSWCRFALASLGDARAADARRFVVVKHDAAITVELAATSSPTDVAVRGLRRFVLLMGTVHRPHKAWCASALRRAPRVCSSTCTLVSVLRLSAVCLCVCLTCTIAGRTAVPNLHCSGICLNIAGPALSRALSVSRDFTCTIPGTCTIQPALQRAQYCTTSTSTNNAACKDEY